MASFADYLHGNGLTLSVYTDAGELNCCQEPGSLGYETIDMQTFADWGAGALCLLLLRVSLQLLLVDSMSPDPVRLRRCRLLWRAD